MTISIRVPATTANLGPGFDCLGLALDLYNEVLIDSSSANLSISIEGEGSGRLPQDESNLIFRALSGYAQACSRSLPSGLSIQCKNHIPMGSGLGSSSAAVVAGILAARQLLGLVEDPRGELAFATTLEGHPDNAAPCLLGGLVAVHQSEDGYQTIKYSLPDLHFVVVLPEFDLPTEKARAALPKSHSLEAALFNLSRIPALIDALTTGNLDNLHDLMDDRLHQPYRLPLIPGASEAMQAAYETGAAGVALSGAGPSLLAILHDAKDSIRVTDAMRSAFLSSGLSAREFFPGISNSGAVIQVV